MAGGTRDYNIRVGIVLRNFDTELKAAESKLRAFSDRAAATGRDLSLLVSAPIIGAGAAALQGAIEFDRLTKALEAISGSSEAAQAQLADLRKIAELPGISFEQATKASISLQGLGFSADEARTAILGVGNAIATSGGSQAQFEGAIRQLAQINAKGRVLQEDITILLENMPVLGKVLRETFGGSTAEAIRATGVSGGEFVDILLEKLNELPKVESGLANSFENLGIAVRFAFASIGQEIDRIFGAKEIFQQLANTVNRVADTFKALDDNTKRSIIRFAAVAAAIGPVLVIGGRLVGAFSGIFQAFNRVTLAAGPFIARMQGIQKSAVLTEVQVKSLNRSMLALRLGLVGIIAIPIAVFLGGLISKWREASKALDLAAQAQKDVQDAISSALSDAQKETTGVVASITALVSIVQDETRAQEERVAALKKIKAEYPGYFDAIREDLSNTELLSGALSKLTTNLVNSAKARALQSRVTEFAEKEVDLQEKLTTALINQELARKRVQKAGFGDPLQALAKLQSGGFGIGGLSNADYQIIVQSAAAYQEAAGQVSRFTKEIESAQSAQEQFAAKAAEFQIKLPGEEEQRVGDPAALKATEAAAREARKKQGQINRIYEDALGKLKALDQVTAQFGGGTLATLEKQAQIARKALQDIYAKGVSESDPRAKKLAEELTTISNKIRDISPLAQIAAIDFAKFAKDGDKEAAKLVNRIEDIAEKSKLLKEPGLELKALSAVFSSAAKSGKSFQETFDAAFSEQRVASIKKQNKEIGDIFDELGGKIDEFNKKLKDEQDDKRVRQAEQALIGFSEALKPLQTGIEDFFDTVFKGEANAFKSFTDSVGATLKKLIGQLAAAAAAALVLGLIIKAVLPALGLGGLAGGIGNKLTNGGQISLIQGLLRNFGVKFFAEGGVVSRPTLGIVGEAGPEAIIPLDRLKEFQGQGGEISGRVVIQGADLALILERANEQRRRARGI